MQRKAFSEFLLFLAMGIAGVSPSYAMSYDERSKQLLTPIGDRAILGRRRNNQFGGT
jgi:hypothetical protein